MVNQISQYINNMRNSLADDDQRRKANELEDAPRRRTLTAKKVKPLFDDIRKNADYIERYCPDMHWAPPKYRELLFVR